MTLLKIIFLVIGFLLFIALVLLLIMVFYSRIDPRMFDISEQAEQELKGYRKADKNENQKSENQKSI